MLFGFMLFALGGQSLFEHGQNPDYRRFGIAGLNVCLFGLLPVLFGATVGPLADRLEPWVAVRLAPRRSELRARLVRAGVVARTTELPGGRGAIRELVETILKAKGRWEDVIQRYMT